MTEFSVLSMARRAVVLAMPRGRKRNTPDLSPLQPPLGGRLAHLHDVELVQTYFHIIKCTDNKSKDSGFKVSL
jgi:hypothetical protein